jgi:hydrogenase/urease accessory protein HupE
MRRALVLAALATVVCLAGGTAVADIAFPARLDIKETAPGVYDVSFTLPIVEGRKLRAEPLLPPTCRDITPREVGVSASGYTSTWQAACEPASLAGEAVLIEGLLGTQTDLAFTLSTVDGRVYNEILRPSRPGFLVPPPPSLPALAAEATGAGMRRVLRQLELWLLLAVLVLAGASRRELASGVAAFTVAHAAGQWCGAQTWLIVTPFVRDAFTLAMVAVPAVALAGAGERWRGLVRPFWPVALLIGLLFGGARPEALPPAGLSNGEQYVALVLFAAGVAAGLLLIAVAAVELRSVLVLVGGGRWQEPGTRMLSTLIGSVATGMLLARLVAVALLPGGVTRAPLELALLAAVLGPTLAAAGVGSRWLVLPFAALATAGLVPGLLGVPLPFGSLLVIGSLMLLGSALAAGRVLPARWAILAAGVATVAHGWSTGSELLENVSRSTGAAVGAVLAASCVLYAVLSVGRDLRPVALPSGFRVLGAGVALAAIVWRLAEYRAWFESQVATEAALGMIRVPVLAVLLLVVAALVWPRRRRVLREFGVESRSSFVHWLMLGGAFLLVPFGTAAVRNPLFEPHAPRGDDARRVVLRVLSDTYHAFNVTDEDELYDQLARSVTDELVDDLYLDSRRRLTAGTREGAEVTVRDVSVLEIGEPVDAAASGQGFAYDCRWVVTARVRHLQHVHHRQNIYNGMLTLQIDGDRWKIAHVDLRSEDRVVLPWKPT